MNVPLFEIYNDEEDVKLVSEQIASGKFWAVGSKVTEFEDMIAEYIGTKHAITFNSGTSALHAALLAHGIGKGDEVIVPSFTFIATVNSPLFVGAKPIFVDIEEETFGLNPELVEEKITKNTKAIIPVHYGGCPCKIKALKDIAEDNDLVLIEDAAEAFGASVDGKNIGTFGDSNILSFCQNKIITTGEGGAVVTDSDEIYEKLKLIRSHGRLESGDYFSTVGLFDYIELGFNWRMSNLTATLGISQIKKADKIIEMRKNNVEYLSKRILEETDEITIPEVPQGYNHVYQLFSVLANKRDELIDYLSDNGISSKIYFDPVHKSEFYKNRLKYDDVLPVTEKMHEKTITLPMFPTLTTEQMDYMADTIGKFYK
ncbi:MAG: DegT/DnrJ/EryC1/StrS family aminotransferase [Methanobrevibacter sp.]|jgi:perosamine synthetase|uniref:DegT/DnrJ/EryC1/StrS family aminotransferase n=1 Tax=Methanobrevibacter sp. TaxID=66852 RepID=UPI0025D680A3|nr:DegT/DnrJ/EryC1/StrS family aminotransferase [Methanobrevibacter sp.]MBE6498173.1 DegT/DnrJ/EryC1/StrS family aminotransferase [Methanobrevibacter sp.]